MKLKKKNNFALFLIQYSFGQIDYYPTNICSMFWGMLYGVFYIVTSPFLFIYLLVTKRFSRYYNNLSLVIYKRKVSGYKSSWLWWVEKLCIFLYILTLTLYLKFQIDVLGIAKEDLVIRWYEFILAPVLVGVCLVIIFLIAAGFIYLCDSTYKGVVNTFTADRIFTKKENKVCKLIEWEDE